MQDSSPFQYIAIDQLFESPTNPRKTFDQSKLEELAASIKHHGLMQPIVVRPKDNRFEVVAGARRFRASLLAGEFSVPAHIKELNDAEVLEWQLVENSQRVDVHPYEEAQGFQRLLDVPGYDVAAIAEKSGKSMSHIYARLSLLQLIPSVADAFLQERITASHASLIARLPQEHQQDAFDNCWRKDWQDKEAHLLPAKHLSAWIEANLYLNLDEAPFDRKDTALKPEAGACNHCPRRSGYNTSLFPDVQGDQCLDSACYQSKVEAHIDRALAARPELVQIQTAWQHPNETRPGVLNKNQYRELPDPDNPDAELPCPSAKPAIIVYGKNVGRTVTVCLAPRCAVHTNHVQQHDEEEEVELPPTMPEATAEETEEEAEQRRVDHEQRMAAYHAEQQRKDEERQAEFERQQKAYDAEQAKCEKLRKARVAIFDRILDEAPVAFSSDQLRTFLRLLLHINPYDFLEEVASHFTIEAEERPDEEVVLAALSDTTDDMLVCFALRIVLTNHIGIPAQDAPDLLTEAEAVFAPKAHRALKSKKPATRKTRKNAA